MGYPFLPFGEISGDWSDKPVYIIGGGPSLVGFDFSRLPDGYKIGANKSAFVADCDTLFSLDQTFVRHTQADLALFAARKEVILAMPTTEDGHKPIEGVTYVRRVRGTGLSKRPDEVWGLNSGYGSLGVAFLRGAKEIALLGFDMQVANNGKSHFHEGYSWHSRQNHKFLNRYAADFDRAAYQLRQSGANVINFVGPAGSKIPEHVFPQRPLGDLI